MAVCSSCAIERASPDLSGIPISHFNLHRAIVETPQAHALLSRRSKGNESSHRADRACSPPPLLRMRRTVGRGARWCEVRSPGSPALVSDVHVGIEADRLAGA